MPNVPVRNLAAGGIIKDIHPTSLPTPAWTGGRNVLFDSGKVQSAPIWRRVSAGLNDVSSVRFCMARTLASGAGEVIVARDDTGLVRVNPSGFVLASETGWTAKTPTEAQWTGGFLGDVLYINRPDIAPRALLPGSQTFTALANWDPTWRCRALRTFQDSLIALNITKNGAVAPSTVKVSDIAFYGTVPGSWDATDPTKLAYESPLSRLKGPILDGLALGDRFLIYTATQVVELRNSGNFIYGFESLPFKDGVLGTNCVVEIDGLHYVFGTRDIYVTDGQTVKSLAVNRVRDAIYRTMNTALRDRAFVAYLPTTDQVVFAYVSGDPETAWNLPTGCNTAWVYSRGSDTWAPIDLPNVSSITQAAVSTVILYSTAGTLTCANIGGSYYDQEGGRDTYTVAVAAPLDTPGSLSAIGGAGLLLAYDYMDTGRLALPVETSCVAPAFVERVGISLDSPQEGLVPLVTTKLIRSIFPQIAVTKPGLAVGVSLAGTETPFARPDFGTPVQFMPGTDYVVDQMASGRYLATRFNFPVGADTALSGFDVDVISNGNR